jgi:hypothetical protein
MNEQIYEPNETFNFQNLRLMTPTIISGGNYFIKFLMNNSNSFYIQLPKCTTKQGIVKTGNKKMHCDLVFTNENENFIQWIENLEIYSRECIFKNREKWFESQLEMNDIENSFSSSLKIFKSGKQYTLRANIPCHLGKSTLCIFNENKTEFDIDNFKENTNIISILEIQGIRCSSKNFQIDYEIKQIMVLKPNILFNQCIIFTPNETITPTNFNKNINEETTNNTIENKNSEIMIEKDDEINKNVNMCNNEIIKIEKELEIKNPNNPTEYDNIVEIDFNLHNISNNNNDDEDDDNNTCINLKNKSEMYYEIYKQSLNDAKQNQILAITNYLKNNNIKNISILTDTLNNLEM